MFRYFFAGARAALSGNGHLARPCQEVITLSLAGDTTAKLDAGETRSAVPTDDGIQLAKRILARENQILACRPPVRKAIDIGATGSAASAAEACHKVTKRKLDNGSTPRSPVRKLHFESNGPLRQEAVQKNGMSFHPPLACMIMMHLGLVSVSAIQP